MRREEDKLPYTHFGVVVVTGVATRHLPCQGDVHGAVAAVPGHCSPIGVPNWCPPQVPFS